MELNTSCQLPCTSMLSECWAIEIRGCDCYFILSAAAVSLTEAFTCRWVWAGVGVLIGKSDLHLSVASHV